MLVNGKEYPLWSQFIDRKDEFIGKKLVSVEDGMETKTTVTDITLEANGDDSAFFSIEGEDFDCGFDVMYGGIGTSYFEGGIGFSSIYSGTFSVDLKAVSNE